MRANLRSLYENPTKYYSVDMKIYEFIPKNMLPIGNSHRYENPTVCRQMSFEKLCSFFHARSSKRQNIPIDYICFSYLYLLYPHISQFIVHIAELIIFAGYPGWIKHILNHQPVYYQSPYIPYPNYHSYNIISCYITDLETCHKYPPDPHGGCSKIQSESWKMIFHFFTHKSCLFMAFSMAFPIWLVVWTHLKNISQLGWLFPIYGKIKNVPNHQPAWLFPYVHLMFQ